MHNGVMAQDDAHGTQEDAQELLGLPAKGETTISAQDIAMHGNGGPGANPWDLGWRSPGCPSSAPPCSLSPPAAGRAPCCTQCLQQENPYMVGKF